ncbi:secreted protein [Candidatus Magnetobacterium bavaricum]|uniref:Secreted protein n=1 Tax=Candidatus Magnetobacterium bavaricum TaxID=29290 RepID=A0A0F3GJI0_9BACT|nr:secreted protein [Candidatus Magnetobacterium bavaricum]
MGTLSIRVMRESISSAFSLLFMLARVFLNANGLLPACMRAPFKTILLSLPALNHFFNNDVILLYSSFSMSEGSTMIVDANRFGSFASTTLRVFLIITSRRSSCSFSLLTGILWSPRFIYSCLKLFSVLNWPGLRRVMRLYSSTRLF